ncbi:MAG: bile acid:sodium symporter family protein [Thermomicrobiales bacterium]|nr:bile acid:sodium symporter family protein [Thermomicrobiales bacterium]
MISETLEIVAKVGILGFVVTSMLSVGMSVTLSQVVAPLRNGRLLGGALLGNFVAVPALALLLGRLLPLDTHAGTALILLGTMAGAPFIPKLAQMAKGDVAFSVGLMVLLMVVTIGYAPIVLPRLVEGVAVAPWDVAKPLVFLMLLPLALAMLVRARYPDLAANWSPELARISSVSLVLALAAIILVAYDTIFGAIGSWILIGAALLAIGSIVIGWVLSSGIDSATQRVAAVGTAQRNLSAAQLVAATSFGGETLVLTIVASLALTAVLLVAAAEMGKRVGQPVAAVSAPSAV